jgi:transposase
MEVREHDLPLISATQQAEVEQLLRQRTLHPRVRERLEMVKARALGEDLASIARWCGRSARRVAYWLERYRTGGPEALHDAPRSGRPPRADAAYRQALAAAVTTPPRDLGLGFDVWTAARLTSYLAEQTGVHLAPGWLRALLNQEGFVTGRPKHTLKHLQDPAAVAACAAELAAAGGSGRRRTGAVRTASSR